MEEEIKEGEEQEPWYKGPIKYIIMLFLILLIVLWVFPSYSVKLDPEPKRIAKINEVLPQNFAVENRNFTLKAKKDFVTFVNPSDPIIKQIATKIATLSCDGNIICQAKAIYYFVRDNIEYVADPVNFEYVEDPTEVLSSAGGDCESGTLLLASLMEAIGVDAELVFIPGHAFLRIRLDDALKKYKAGEWIYLDWTCKTCRFGEIPLSDKNKEMRFLGV